jgi:hypothetical protein
VGPNHRIKNRHAVCGLAHRDLQLKGRASYARGIGEDPLKDLSSVNIVAALNWKIGSSFLGEQSLSFQVE